LIFKSLIKEENQSTSQSIVQTNKRESRHMNLTSLQHMMYSKLFISTWPRVKVV